MALFEEQITEKLESGAPDITYEGNEGKEQQIARELWDQLPPQAQQQFGNFQQFFSSGAWKEVLAQLQQAQEGLGSMMPAQMAYGGIAGADGRKAYGIGSWFQKKIMDPIKKNPLLTAAAVAAGSQFLGPTAGWMSEAWKKIPQVVRTGAGKGLKSILSSPEWAIPAASLVAGAFAKPEEQLGGGITSRGPGINLQDIAKLANITGEQEGQTIGLNFLPEASARKYSPEEMALKYSQATVDVADGGRIGYANGGDWDADWDDVIDPSDPDQPDPNWQPDWDDYLDVATMDEIALEFQQEFGYDLMLAKPELREWYINKWKEKNFYDKSEAPAEKRVMAQEGGLMSLGGMEMDLRGGGFVPLGAKEKADDVPARLSKNEFVFTADAVRAAGGGDVDAGADKMYNTMKQLESRVG